MLADPYYPGWEATINGAPAQIVNAAPGQIAFLVPAGAPAGPAVLRLQAGAEASLPIAIHHAWIVNRDGQAIDVTLKWEPTAAYCGVIFQARDLSRRLLKKQTYGLFDDGVGYTDLIKGTDPHFSYRRSHEIARTA